MTRYQFYKIVLYILFIYVVQARTLDTALGICELEIFDKETEIQLIETTIISYAHEVNKKFIPINPQPYSIHITTDLEDFYKKSQGPVPEWGIAITKKNPNRVIMQSPATAGISFKKLLQILIHELNHVYLNNITHSYSFPSWFKEGMAMSESGEFSINHRILISSAKWQKQLFGVNELINFNRVNKYNSRLAYAESYAMFISLQSYYGADIYKKVLSLMNDNYQFWDALVYITGDQEDVIKNNIEYFLIKNYNWMFLLKSYNLIFIFLPLILISGFLYKKYKNRKLLRKWEIEELLEDLNNSNEEAN